MRVPNEHDTVDRLKGAVFAELHVHTCSKQGGGENTMFRSLRIVNQNKCTVLVSWRRACSRGTESGNRSTGKGRSTDKGRAESQYRLYAEEKREAERDILCYYEQRFAANYAGSAPPSPPGAGAGTGANPVPVLVLVLVPAPPALIGACCCGR